MRLEAFGLVADENIPRALVAQLRTSGYDIVSVTEIGLAGADDQSVLERAHTERRVVLTHDSDFGTMAIAGRIPFTGIVYLRPGHLSPAFTIATWNTLIGLSVELIEPFIVVAERAEQQVRVRVRSLAE
ncbi:MAG: hypothetical protein GC162_02865 [Planctomycetes bacterium]|nr:hypothetical protein [Planctomycetota bacterium]